MTPELLNRLNSSSGTTLFLPVDQAWDKLDPIERLYLESEFAADDLHRILDMHAVADEHVTWSDSFEPAVNRKFDHLLYRTTRLTKTASDHGAWYPVGHRKNS